MFDRSPRINAGVAGKGDTVTFEADGVQRDGVALMFFSDRMAVGVQDRERPTVLVTAHRRDGSTYQKRVANNSLWIVPYANVIGTRAA